MRMLEYKNQYWKDNPEHFLELLALVQKFSHNGTYVRMLKANGKKLHLNNESLWDYMKVI